MSWGLRGEDEYWENLRERMENPRRPNPGDWDYEPEYKKGYFYLDDNRDEIEEERGWPIEELTEGDLLEIIEEFLDIVAVDAEYDSESGVIKYRYQVA